MDDTALDWFFYALALLVFIVISTVESRRAQRREARVREAAARTSAPAPIADPHAWGHGAVAAGPDARPEADVERGISAPPDVLAGHGAVARLVLEHDRRLRPGRARTRLRNAVVMMVILGPRAGLQNRRGMTRDPP